MQLFISKTFWHFEAQKAAKSIKQTNKQTNKQIVTLTTQNISKLNTCTNKITIKTRSQYTNYILPFLIDTFIRF